MSARLVRRARGTSRRLSGALVDRVARVIRILRFLFSREVITYLIAGVLTTLVNLAVFTLLTRVFGADRWWISNLPAIVLAMLFAFYINRRWVFRSQGPVLREMLHFFAGRIVISLAFEYGAMYLFYNLAGIRQSLVFLSWSLPVSKLLTQILVVVGNYVMSKWLIFNRQELPSDPAGSRPPDRS